MRCVRRKQHDQSRPIADAALYCKQEVRLTDSDNPVYRSLELIEKRISEKLTIENIASGVYFSKHHYQRLFREIVGNSVMEYVTKRKLTLAGRALIETDASIIDIALDYGYESREGFTRSFKAYMGVTPTEYRKYGLAAIKQNTVKERLTMMYSKTTDEIIRELNEFIAKAKETAALARKCELSVYAPFWSLIGNKTDKLADQVNRELTRITVIAEQPDKITGMFDIVKVLDDITYQINLVSFNTRLMVSRAIPEHVALQKPLLQKYGELARDSIIKAKKITEFFNELATLIIDDMRKAASSEIEAAIQKGKIAADNIKGYNYIRDEVSNVANTLSETPLAEITVSLLEDLLFRLDIICFTADMDTFRNPQDLALFSEIESFKACLTDAHHFFQKLVTPQNAPVIEMTADKLLSDIGFQGNMHLFYIRGEAEKLGVSLDEICEKVNSFIRFAQRAADKSLYRPTADMLFAINTEMLAKAEELGERGGAIKFLADELRGLGNALAEHILD